VALAILAPWSTPLSASALVACAVAYLCVARVSFTVSDGTTVPTQIVFLPMLFVLPTPLVPISVGLLALVARVTQSTLDGTNARRSLFAFGDSWYAPRTALVLVLADAQRFDWSHWPVYVVAIGAQLGLDAGSALLRGWLIDRVAPLTQLRLLAWIYLVDVELSAIGLLAAYAASDRPGLVLLLRPARGDVLAVRARAARAARPRDRAQLRLPGHRPAPGHHGGGRRRLHRQPQPRRARSALNVADQLGLDSGAGATSSSAPCCTTSARCGSPRRSSTSPARSTRRMGAHAAAHHLGRGDARAGRRRPGRGGPRGALLTRAFRRRRLPDGLRGDEIPIESRNPSPHGDAFSAMTTDRP
jgi:hypothetical protein